MSMQVQKIPHLIVAGPGQWGQQAIWLGIIRALAGGGRVTVIVPRRYQHQFENVAPSFKDWGDSPSVAARLAELQRQGRPVHVTSDDHLSHLGAQLIDQRASGEWQIVGYVATAAEEHLPLAQFLVNYCERLLIEKPASTVWEDVQTDGPYTALANEARQLGCELLFADHFLFRRGVSSAL